MEPDRPAPRAQLIMGRQAGRTYHNQPEHWASLTENMRRAELSATCITDDLRSLAPRLTGDLTDPKRVTPVEGVRVLAEGEGQSMVYVWQYGQGRVAYLASGHDRRSLLHPIYQTLFRWAAR